MFENDDVQVDDDFFDAVFENDDGVKRNEHSASKSSTDILVGFNTPSSSIKNCIANAREPSCTSNLFRLRCDVSSSCSTKISSALGPISTPQKQVENCFGGKENKRKASPPPSRSKRDRKFPGPAGLLPDKQSFGGTPLKLENLPQVDSPSASTPDDLCSQGRLSGSVLSEGPWQSLVHDLGRHADLLHTVNIASVKRKAAARLFVGRKVPFLAAVLHHLDVSSADPCVILRDATGEIHGTLHREVWQQFAAELVVGSVLVIRNVGLLSTGLSCRRHYLNITVSNLTTIYSANPEKPQRRELHPFTSHDFESSIQQWQSLAATAHLASPSNPSRLTGKSLFPSDSSLVQKPAHVLSRFSSPHCTVSESNQNVSRSSLNHSLTTNQNVSRSSLNHSLTTCSTINQNRKSDHNVPTKDPAPSFKFDPVILKNKACTSASYPHKNLQNQSILRNESRIDSETNSETRIVLSQSSQLTVEEQSIVESVLDGIDADSLFDDDF